jgi:ferredoxin-NADP reductase
MSNSRDLLKNIVGYTEGALRKDAREKVGDDFSDQKWKTASDIARLHPKRLNLSVSEIFQDTPSTKTFRLKSNDLILPPFQAGQYINLYTSVDGVETARPYAISSCPTEREYYDLTVKIVEGGFVTHYLLSDQVKVGQTFSATSPMGTFYHNPIFHGDDLVFLAGGSGGAPARSMIESLMHQNANRGLNINFHLVYGNSYENDVIFQHSFRELADKHHNFTLTEIVSRPTESYTGLTGHLNKDRLVELLGDVSNKTFYVCGPTPFNDFCQQQLKELGVADKRIRIECNGPPKNPGGLTGWPQVVSEEDEVTVTVKGRGQFIAKTGEPLLNSLERNGYTVENACRSGECSLCRVKVLEGEVFNPPEALLRKSDKDFGWVHSCVAYPTTDIEILY